MSTDQVVVDDLASGYEGKEVLGPTQTPEEEPTETVPAEVPPAEVPPPEPKFRQITEDEYTALMDVGKTVESLREENARKFDQAFGKIGGTEQLVRNIQAATPKGKIPTVTKDDLGDLAKNYEYLGDDMVDAFNRVLGKLEGTGPAQAGVDQNQIAQLVQEGVAKALPKLAEEIEKTREQKLVTKAHPDAQETFADPAFIDWFKKSGKQDSWESEKIIPILTEYKQMKAPPAVPPVTPAPSTRQAALKAAVNPIGAPAVPKAKTEDDEFLAGYNSRDT